MRSAPARVQAARWSPHLSLRHCIVGTTDHHYLCSLSVHPTRYTPLALGLRGQRPSIEVTCDVDVSCNGRTPPFGSSRSRGASIFSPPWFFFNRPAIID